jgi:hypothetical protein
VGVIKATRGLGEVKEALSASLALRVEADGCMN